MKTYEEKSVYVQPGMKVYQVVPRQMIATSITDNQTTVSDPFSENKEEEI